MTFADLVAALDKAAAPIIAVLEKAGPQWMAGPNNTVQIFTRDSSPLGFHVDVAQQAAATNVITNGQPSPVAQALAAAKAQIETAGKEASLP